MSCTNVLFSVSTCHMHRVKKIYDLQMNVTVSGRDGRVYITEMVDDVDQVL